MQNKGASNKTVLKIEKLWHSFHDKNGDPKRPTEALENISFEVERGKFVSIIGPSGCGKSTLLRLIAGLQPVERGTIERNFKELSMIFQSHAIFPWLTVGRNVAFGLEMKNTAKSRRHKIVAEKLDEVGLGQLSSVYPNQLSGGQKQRVSVARALAVSPEILLMDEPFSSLDSITAEKLKVDIFRLFKKYDMTVVMVNHLIEDAIELSDEVIVLTKSPGKIKECMKIDLPYPRNKRSAHFFALVDKIRNLIEE